jgi:hypothetical protein
MVTDSVLQHRAVAPVQQVGPSARGLSGERHTAALIRTRVCVYVISNQKCLVHRQLVGDIVEARKSGTSVALVLERAIPFLKMYGTYISNYNRAMELLKRLETDPSFVVFKTACELQRPCHGLDFRAFLIQPVQVCTCTHS